MKKIVFILVSFFILIQVGCSKNVNPNSDNIESDNIPQNTNEQSTPLTDSSNTENIEDDLEDSVQSPPLTESQDDENVYLGDDDGVWIKVMSQIVSSNEQKLYYNLEFVGLILDIEKKNDNEYIISYDKVEPTENNDPKEDFFTNEVELTEQITIETHVLTLIDPHIGFRSVKMDSLISYIAEFEDYSIPFYFYSLNGDIAIIAEMMLP